MSINHNESDILLIKDKIRDNELFRNSNTSDLDFDKLDFRIIDLESGEILFREDDPANSIYLVIEGEINLIKKQSIGKTQILLSKNNFFSHEEYFLQTSRNSIAIALSDSQIVELSKEIVEVILPQNLVLNNIKDSVLALDHISTENFNVTDELTERPEKKNSVLPMELKTNNNKKSSPTSKDERETQRANTVNYNKIDLNEIGSGINKIICNVNENLSLIEEEKDKMRNSVLRLEDYNKKLLDEIGKQKELESKFVRLDREKNEILGWQSYRIIELERETEKFKDLESEYSQKIETLTSQGTKNTASIEKLEAELKEKDKIISKLDSVLKENKKTISDFDETHLKLLQEIEERVHLIEAQKEKIKNLSEQLSKRDIRLKELKEDLSNKNELISSQNDSLNRINAEISELSSSLEKKNEEIEGLSSKLTELQKQQSNQKEREKSKDEFILNQSHKIAEYEEKLKNLEKESSQREVIINKFIEDIGEFARGVWHNQNEINRQEVIINKFVEDLGEFARGVWHKQNEINELKKSSEEFYNKEPKLQKEVSDLQSQLAEANNKLSKISEDTKEKVDLIQSKENENEELKAHILDIREKLNEAKNAFQSKDNQIADLENVVKQLKDKSGDQSELQKLKDDLNKLSNQLSQKNKDNLELNNEKNNLLERIEKQEQITEENKDKSNSLLKLKEDLDTLMLEVEKYKNLAAEKDNIIDQQKEQLENQKVAQSEEIKTLAATKKSYQEDIKKKNEQISNMNTEIEEIKKILDEKNITEEQKNETIENQAQIIAELKTLANEFKAKDEEKNVEENGSVLANDSENGELSPKPTSNEDVDILSKSKFIASASSNSLDDKSFECVIYEDIYIVNVNLSRATLDDASSFSKFLSDLIDANKNKLIVNLSKCEYLDSSILGALVSSLKKTTSLGGDLRIVWLDQSEYSMLHLTRMDKIFQIFNNLKDAVISYRKEN